MDSPDSSLEVFPIEWTGEDASQDGGELPQYRVTMYGKTADGQSVCAHIAFYPYFFVDMPREWSDARRASFVAEAVMKHGAVPQYSRTVRRASIWGFRPRMPDGTPVLEAVAQLAFPTREAAKKARYKYKYEKRQTYEAAVDPLIRLFHIRDIVPARWVTLRDFQHVPDKKRKSVADIEVSLVFTGVFPSLRNDPPPLVIASWDIECYSKSGNFPLPHLESDKCIQIATSFQRYGAPEPYLNTVVALEETDDVEGAEITSVATEPELFAEWADLLRREKVDILVSYNGHQFDWKYVLGRQAVLVDDVSGEPLVDLSALGRAVEGGGLPKEFSLNSAAYGQNSFTIAQTPGVLQIDLLQHMRREHKLESYSLDNVSKKFLGDAKLDLPPSEIFRKFLVSSKDRADIARYAVKDTVLPLRLLQKLAVLENLFEMANAVTVPVEYLLNRGQQIKVFSLILKKARQHSFVCPDDEGIGTTGKYEGATVLDAQRGAYFDIVSGLDFASLYPSIIRAHTMCYSTIVLDARYADLPGVEYYTIQTGMGTYKFAQSVTSVVPELLEELAAFRKASKKDMAAAKQAGDAFGVSVHNGKQLAYKISANSVYGFLGATKGFMPIVPIASAVTATGRAMIEHTKALAEKLVPGSRVVYGDTDSVMVIFETGDAAKKHDMQTHFDIAERVAAEISKTFKRPIELEFEKCYYPYLLFSKKRYAGAMYTNPDKYDYVDVKGIQLVRRDNCPLVREVSQAVLDVIMDDKDPQKAVDVAREHLRRVLNNEHPIEKFVVSKALRGNYKNPNLPHALVAKKIHQRRGYPVNNGERVPYVFVEDYTGKALIQALRAEDPDYVVANGLKLDLQYYIEHQLQSPIQTLLELLVKDPLKAIFAHADIKDVTDTENAAKRVRTNAARGQKEITSFFEKT